jgi:LysM repeat protein
MNAGAIVVLFLIVVAIVWAFWLIFKRDFMKDNNVWKLLAYFAGVILTLLIVLWVTSRFLPWWAVRLITDTQQSQNVKDLSAVVEQLVNNPEVVLTTAPTQAPGTTPTVTVSPVVTPEIGSVQPASVAIGESTHIVKAGEGLYSICRQYYPGIAGQQLKQCADKIKQRNSLSSDQIYPGQTLVIPSQ